jgi:hypothetical protein
MKQYKFRLSAVVIAAMLIATLVVSPAVGGPSLKQWVKQRVTSEVDKKLSSKSVKNEVKRQVKKRLKQETGPAGPTGPPGADGAGGAAGSGIVASASLDGPAVTTGVSGASSPLPLTDASWTQAAGEIDEVYAEVTHTGLAGTCEGGAGPGSALIQIQLPGGKLLNLSFFAGTPAGAVSTSQPTVVMPSLAGDHTLTATVRAFCDGPENTTVTGIDIYVVATN